MPLDPRAACTVCIPTYNQAEHLRAAVLSVVAQTAPVRLLVADDCSPDDTAQVLAELQRQYEFQAHTHPQNLGISQNLQWLLRQPATPYIMRLDSDDSLHPEYIRELQALLERYPRAGYAHSAIQDIDDQGRPLRERRLARTEEFQDAETALRRAVNGYQVTANILLFRREALESVNFGAGSSRINFVEDYDLSIRLADAGWGNVYSPRVLASYRLWQAASRPPVKRKLTEVRGLVHIFAGPLTSAFERRGWSPRLLQHRRRSLAVANSEILDRGPFENDEQGQMRAALLSLSDAPSVRVAVSRGPFGFLVRRLVTGFAVGQQRAKYLVKKLLFRR